MKEVQLLLKDVSNNLGSQIFIVGDLNLDLLKQNNLFSKYSNLLQYNRMMQLLTTATRDTKDSATLIDQVFHNHFFTNPDCGLLDAGLTDHCATFVKLPISCKKYDSAGTTNQVLLFTYIKNASQYHWKYIQMN